MFDIFNHVSSLYPNNSFRKTGDDMGIGVKDQAFLKPFTNPLYDIYGQAGVFQAVTASLNPIEGAPGAYALDPVLADVLGYGTQYTGALQATPLMTNDLDYDGAVAAGSSYVSG